MTESSVWDVIVLGGGAAGFFAALTCMQKNPSARVALLERSNRVLAKVKISGGGRCNVTHACFDPAQLTTFYPRGGKALRGPFTRFQPQDTMNWFEKRGVRLKTEPDGRVFPISDNAQTIIDCLTTHARGVHIQLNASVVKIEKNSMGSFVLHSSSGETWSSKRVILATGSSPLGWDWAKSLGHTIEPPVPSLFTFSVKDPRLEGLSGLSVPQARLHIEGMSLTQEGALLLTHWGLSGPAVLKLSAWGARVLHEKNYSTRLKIQWDAALSAEDWMALFHQLRTQIPKKQVTSSVPSIRLPQRLWSRLTQAAGIAEALIWADVSKDKLIRLTQELHAGIYSMNGKSAFKEEFVTCGGIRLDEVDFRTMESKCCPNLYLVGEMLDVDAVTGGFNFQNAWTTGWIAGMAAATFK